MANNLDINTLRDDFLNALLQGDKQGCLRMSRNFFESGSDIIELYEQLFRDSLYQVGILWQNNKISVAKEHQATAIVEGIMNTFYAELFPEHKTAEKVIITCAENEQHQVGAKMVSDIFERMGWDAVYVGASSPADQLYGFIEEEKPDLLAISLSLASNARNAMSFVQELRGRYPELGIILGGQAFLNGLPPHTDLTPNCHLISTLSELESFIGSFE